MDESHFVHTYVVLLVNKLLIYLRWYMIYKFSVKSPRLFRVCFSYFPMKFLMKWYVSNGPGFWLGSSDSLLLFGAINCRWFNQSAYQWSSKIGSDVLDMLNSSLIEPLTSLTGKDVRKMFHRENIRFGLIKKKYLIV